MLSQAYLLNMEANKKLEKKIMQRRGTPVHANTPYKYTLNRRAQVIERNARRIPPRYPPHSSRPAHPVHKNTRKKNHSSRQTVSTITTNNKGLVSVIIVTDNSRKYVYNAVYTLLRQTHKNLELIIVDNNSSDGTLEYLKNIRDDRIKLYSLKERTTLANCRNLGMHVSKGSYLTFQEPNYVSITERLDKQLKQMNNESVSVVGEQISETDGIICNYSSLMITRKQFDTFGFFRDHEKHMLEYVKRLKKNNIQVSTVNDLYYIRYDTLANGITNNQYHLDKLDEFPEEEVSIDTRVDFSDLEKFNV